MDVHAIVALLNEAVGRATTVEERHVEVLACIDPTVTHYTSATT